MTDLAKLAKSDDEFVDRAVELLEAQLAKSDDPDVRAIASTFGVDRNGPHVRAIADRLRAHKGPDHG